MKTKKEARKAAVTLILVTSVVLLGIGSYFIVNEIINKNDTEVNDKIDE